MKTLKENIVGQARRGKNSEERLNLLREALHHLLLQEVDRKGAFSEICLVGGTALRILYGLDRFSEDLDFSTSSQMIKEFELESLARSVQHALEGFGLLCEVRKLKTEKTVQSCFFSFSEMLAQVDRSFRTGQKLAIKFEVDSHPPSGANEMVSPVTGQRVYKIRHYDLPSLFAGKIHALLYRLYTKGRDLYDFLWYTGRSIKIKRPFLQNAIEQTEKIKLDLNDDVLKKMILKKFEKTDFERAQKDVGPFLVDLGGVSLFEKQVFLSAVQRIELTD